MLAWWLLVLLAERPDPFAALHADEVEVRPLLGVTSPTGLLWHDGELLVAADLTSPKPGIYRVIREEDRPWQAKLMHYLPQQEIQGISAAEGDRLLVASSRFFNAFEADWTNQAIVVHHGRRRVLDRRPLPFENRCGSGEPECGVAALFTHEDPNRLIAATRRGMARLMELKRIDAARDYAVVRATPLWVERRLPVISDGQRVGDDLVFLLQKRRQLARMPLEILAAEKLNRIDLEVVFDYGPVAERLVPKSNRLSYGGCAEAFCFDDAGNLYLVLNNRGFPWRVAADGVEDPYPKLLIFRPSQPDR